VTALAVNDELTVAHIELDAAWEAHRQLQVELDRVKAELEGHKRLRRLQKPRMEAFERISTRVFEWRHEEDLPSSHQYMERIEEHIADARRECERIAEIQRKRQEGS
jgi:hypothetical protein